MTQITKPTVGATGWNTATDALIDQHNTLDSAGGAASVTVTTALAGRVTTLEALPAPGDPDVAWSQVTTLPHMVIATASGADPADRETYLDATITINGPLPLTGATQIRGRGNTTWEEPKKPWRLKLTTAASPLGIPAERDFAMLANYRDGSIGIRNAAAFEIANRCPGLAWTPRYRFCELTMNGTYRGLYQLVEHVERGTNKIPGSAATGTTGLSLTGVYTLEIDRRYVDGVDAGFTTELDVMVAMDDPDDTVPQHKTYIQNWVQNFEDVLLDDDVWLDPTDGYAQYIDMASWVDWYMVNELLANGDSNGFASIKMYKTRDVTGTPGRLYLGPTWDHDSSFGVFGGGGTASPTEPYVTVPSAEAPGFLWLARMREDPTFNAMLVSRWVTLKASLTLGDSIFAVIDRLVDRFTYAVGRDQRRWELETDIPANVDALKTWLAARIVWLSTQWIIDTEDPSTPTGLSATPGDTAVALSWSASTDDHGVDHYIVRRGGTTIGTPSGTSYNATGLTNDTEYSFTVSAVDGVGNESPQTSPVTATPVAGEGGGGSGDAVRFSETGDMLTRSETGPDPSATGYTVTLWAYLSTDRNDYSTLFRYGGTGGGSSLVCIETEADGTALWMFSVATTPINSTLAMTPGAWHRIAYTVAADATAHFYTAAATGSVTDVSGTGGSFTAGTTHTIGGHPASSPEWFNGRIAHVRVWAAALSQAEVVAEWASATPVKTSGLWAAWPLDGAADLADDSGNSRTLTAGSTSVTTEDGPPVP